MNEWVECRGRGADKRAVSRRQDGRVESDTTNCCLRLDDGLGVDHESDGGSAATLAASSRSGKGAPTGMGRSYGFQPWKWGLG